MFNPVAVILGVSGDYLTICKTTYQHGDGWTWDLDKLESMSKQEFKDWISYNTIDHWCDVSEHKHKFAVEIFNAA